jgi:hypothetical protein
LPCRDGKSEAHTHTPSHPTRNLRT